MPFFKRKPRSNILRQRKSAFFTRKRVAKAQRKALIMAGLTQSRREEMIAEQLKRARLRRKEIAKGSTRNVYRYKGLFTPTLADALPRLWKWLKSLFVSSRDRRIQKEVQRAQERKAREAQAAEEQEAEQERQRRIGEEVALGYKIRYKDNL